jgi:hypothetical protein
MAKLNLKVYSTATENIVYSSNGDSFKIEYPEQDLSMKTFVETMKEVSKQKPTDVAHFFQLLKSKLDNF